MRHDFQKIAASFIYPSNSRSCLLLEQPKSHCNINMFITCHYEHPTFCFIFKRTLMRWLRLPCIGRLVTHLTTASSNPWRISHNTGTIRHSGSRSDQRASSLRIFAPDGAHIFDGKEVVNLPTLACYACLGFLPWRLKYISLRPLTSPAEVLSWVW